MNNDLRVVTFFLKDSLGAPPPRIDLLPSVELQATQVDTLQELARRALDIAGLGPLEYHNILFVALPDETGTRVLASYLDVGIGEDGRLFWRVGAGSADTTIGDVERAAEEGLFSGDPHAYSVDRGGYGDSGFVLHWDDLYTFLKEVGAIGGGVAFISVAANWLIRFVTSHVGKWIPRHARFPATFLNSIVCRSEWSPSTLARLLDVPEPGVRELLTALGYVPGADGLFRFSDDPEKAQLRKRLAEEHFLWDGWHEMKKPPSEDEPPG